jgi:holin-like protein
MLRRANIVFSRNRLLQVAWLFAFWELADALARALALPLPGGVVGLLLLLLLLALGWVPTAWVRRGSNGLLNHMLLFFAPATMALLDHRDLFGLVGLKIVVVIAVGTVLVMTGTALVVDLAFRWRVGHAD